jgi:hypothetical protein
MLEANSIELVVQCHDLNLSLKVDFVIQAGGHSVPGRLPILRHQDHWRL